MVGVKAQFEYRDPLEVLIRKEEKTCKGCCHESTYSGFGTTITVCMKPDNVGRRRKHGTRCKDYREKP